MLGKEMLEGGGPPERIQQEGDVFDDGYLHVEHDRYYVACDGRPIFNLSRKEFLILSRLARGNSRVVTKEEIWVRAWGDAEFNYNTFRVHIASLRRKLSSFGLDIVAVVHVGYRLVRSDPSNQAEVQSQQPTSTTK